MNFSNIYSCELEDKIDSKVTSAIKVHLTKFNQVVYLVEDNNRTEKLNDAILRGIPYKVNEKLQNIFDLIGKAVTTILVQFSSSMNYETCVYE